MLSLFVVVDRVLSALVHQVAMLLAMPRSLTSFAAGRRQRHLPKPFIHQRYSWLTASPAEHVAQQHHDALVIGSQVLLSTVSRHSKGCTEACSKAAGEPCRSNMSSWVP